MAISSSLWVVEIETSVFPWGLPAETLCGKPVARKYYNIIWPRLRTKGPAPHNSTCGLEKFDKKMVYNVVVRKP